MENYTAGLIVIGDEILRGQVVDMNTSYLAKSLRRAGLILRKVTVLPDIIDEIAAEVSDASTRYSVVFTSGGVGPTHDDVTYEAVAKALGLKLELREDLIDIFARLMPTEPETRRLAVVPQPCELITVKSTAEYPVVKTRNVYVLPGSPKFFRSAVDAIVPHLKGMTPLHFEHVDVECGELTIVNALDELATRWAGKVKIGSYPQSGCRWLTRITLEGWKVDVLNAKDELVNSLLDNKVAIIENKFTIRHALAVLDDSKNKAHVQKALDILEQCYNRYSSDEIFLSFNGGKDCTVVLHLVATYAKLHGLKPPSCLYVTDDPFPEVEVFVEQATQYYGVELIRKTKPIRSALEALLREKEELKASLVGTRKGDPGSENLEAFTATDPGWPTLMRVNPILDWTYNQIWEFLLTNKVPYCPLYDQGYTSIGSRSTTVENLLLSDPNNPSSYLPAYTLSITSAERCGRD